MLKIEHLKKSYENFSLDCSLEVKKGHVTGLIGQNGAGKSTTFKAILGLISFDSGTINILGKSLQDFTAKDKQDLGVVLSDSGFSGYLTINDIIPIIDNLYQNFDKSFFIEQVKKFQLPRNKRITGIIFRKIRIFLRGRGQLSADRIFKPDPFKCLLPSVHRFDKIGYPTRRRFPIHVKNDRFHGLHQFSPRISLRVSRLQPPSFHTRDPGQGKTTF